MTTPSADRRPIVVAGAALFVTACTDVLLGILGDNLLWFFVIYGVGTLCVLIALVAGNRISLPTLKPAGVVAAIVATAFALRLYLSFHGPILSFDSYWYADYVNFMRSGAAPYSGFYFPYPPAFALFLKLFVWCPNPVAAIRISMVVIDALNAGMIFTIVRKGAGIPQATLVGASYALLPAAVLESGRNAHFEPLVSLLLLLFAMAVLRRRAGFAAAFLVVATGLKAFPIVAFPALLPIVNSRRRLVAGIGGGLVTAALLVLPFRKALISASARSGVGISHAPLFTANSLPAFAADFPVAFWAPIAGYCVLGLSFVTLFVAAAASYLRGDARRTMGPVLAQWEHRLLRASFAGVCCIFGLYGIYLALSPSAPSEFVFTWWMPPQIQLARGAILIACAVAGVAFTARLPKTISPFDSAVILITIAMSMLIITHANVNPWYFMPAIALGLCAASFPPRAVLICALCVCYAAYNASSFSALGWSDTAAQPQNWAFTALRIGGGSEAKNAIVVTNLRTGFIVDLMAAQGVSAHANSVSATLSIRRMIDPAEALAFDVLGDSDPTFHRHAASLSVYALGETQHRTLAVPLIAGDESMTDLGAVRYRISERRMAPLTTLNEIRFVLRRVGKSANAHRIKIENVRVVDERPRPFGYAWAALAVAIFSGFFIFGRRGLSFPAGAPPIEERETPTVR